MLSRPGVRDNAWCGGTVAADEPDQHKNISSPTGKSAGYRTLDAKPSADSMIKPGELVDLVEVTPLTLTDRRIYNQLLENAWNDIDTTTTHLISKAQLRGSHNSNDRVGESIERLMTAIVKIKVLRAGREAVERVQLLGGNTESLHKDGLLQYDLPGRLRNVIRDSTVFARLQRDVMFALSSKYALTLYEMVQKRGNLRYRNAEKIALEDLRGVLGVPPGKLSTWSNLKLRALDPAVKEVSALSDYTVAIEPVKTGRRVTHVELRWWPKGADGTEAAEREIANVKTGRRARLEGSEERVLRSSSEAVAQKNTASTGRSFTTTNRQAGGQEEHAPAGEEQPKAGRATKETTTQGRVTSTAWDDSDLLTYRLPNVHGVYLENGRLVRDEGLAADGQGEGQGGTVLPSTNWLENTDVSFSPTGKPEGEAPAGLPKNTPRSGLAVGGRKPAGLSDTPTRRRDGFVVPPLSLADQAAAIVRGTAPGNSRTRAGYAAQAADRNAEALQTALQVPLRAETYETARLRHPGYDIYHVEREWRRWASGRDEPVRNPDGAFLAFFRTFARNNPV